MVKWKVFACLGLAFGIVGIGWGNAQAKKAVGFFELRVYTAQPGKRDALAARFANRTAAIYAKHGITNVGYLDSQQSDPELVSVPRIHSFTFEATHQKKSGTNVSQQPTRTRSLSRS